MRQSCVYFLAIILISFVPITASTAAQEATPAMEAPGVGLEVVASGLTNPRGFTWAEDGTLYVTLAGTGGPNLPTENAPWLEAFGGYYGGPSASIARIENSCPATVADGFPSYVDGSGWTIGVSDVAFLDGQLYATVDGGGPVHANPDQPAGVYRVNEDGTTEVIADLSAWIRANPVAELPTADNDPDGEVWHMVPAAEAGAFWVIESNQGQLLHITLDGEITRVADLSAGHPVPTGLALAPEGGVFVGTLTAFPFSDGAAKVMHIAEDGSVTERWTGLTAITALAIGADDALYATEMVTGSIDEDPFILPDSGRIVRLTGQDEMEVVADGLNFPVALDFGPDGQLYIGSPALGAPAGAATISRVNFDVGASTPAASSQCLVSPEAD